MQWEKSEIAVPIEGSTVFCTGYHNNNPQKKRWYTVAVFEKGAWIDIDDGEELYPATHWIYIKEPE